MALSQLVHVTTCAYGNPETESRVPVTPQHPDMVNGRLMKWSKMLDDNHSLGLLTD
jgi:hypothetical protein